MSTAKITISMNSKYLRRLDRFVKHKVFKNRSQAIQHAVILELDRLEHRRLADECAKLNADDEAKLAEEGMTEDMKE